MGCTIVTKIPIDIYYQPFILGMFVVTNHWEWLYAIKKIVNSDTDTSNTSQWDRHCSY